MRVFKSTAMTAVAAGLLASTAVGVSAQDEGAGSDYVFSTGTLIEDAAVYDFHFDDSADAVALGPWQLEATDQRLSGESWLAIRSTLWPQGTDATDPRFAIVASTQWIVNDDGEWISTMVEGNFGDPSQDEEDEYETVRLLFAGSGDYEGLTAYLVFPEDVVREGGIGEWAFEAIVFEGEPPAFAWREDLPGPFAAE